MQIRVKTCVKKDVQCVLIWNLRNVDTPVILKDVHVLIYIIIYGNPAILNVQPILGKLKQLFKYAFSYM